MNVRAQAALTLAPVLRAEQSLQTSFDSAVEKLDVKDRGLFHELVFGCLRHYEWLNAIFQLLAHKKLKNKDQDVAALVLLGLYQLHYLRVPDHAAISETVNATKKLKKHWAKGFVNASLRNFTRQQDELIAKISEDKSVQARLPWWIVKRIQQDWPEQLNSITQANQHKAPITLRNNAQRQTRSSMSEMLTAMNVQHTIGKFSAQAISLDSSADINRLTQLEQGKASVQDEAAQLSAELLALEAGHRVLDACAAPGGKSCHILEQKPDIKLTALELDSNRSKQISANLSRLNLAAEIKVCDASDVDSWWNNELFDRILIDAPCSAIGVIRRHPDIKLLRRESDLDKLVTIQKKLLQNLWPCLAPGGILIYATCSILKIENEDIVSDFCKHNEDAQHINIEADWGQQRPYGRQLLPKLDGHDGFYYAKLQKIKS